jgi:hypothetical protein
MIVIVSQLVVVNLHVNNVTPVMELVTMLLYCYHTRLTMLLSVQVLSWATTTLLIIYNSILSTFQPYVITINQIR